MKLNQYSASLTILQCALVAHRNNVCSFHLSSPSMSTLVGNRYHHLNSYNGRYNCYTKKRQSVSILSSSNNESGIDNDESSTSTSSIAPQMLSEAEQLRRQAKRVKLEAEKMEAELTLQKIQSFEASLKALNEDGKSKEDIKKKRREIQIKIQNLARNIDPNLAASLALDKFEEDEIVDDLDILNVDTNLFKSKNDAAKVAATNAMIDLSQNLDSSAATYSSSANSNVETNLYKNRTFQKPQPTLSESELSKAVEYYNSLPKVMQKTLASAIDLNDERTDPSVIVLGLYEFIGTDNLDPHRLNRLYNNLLLHSSIQNSHKRNGEKEEEGNTKSSASATTLDEALTLLRQNMKENDVGKNDAPIDDELKLATMVESFLPRVTRKEGKEPTLADVNMLKTCQILSKETFQMSSRPQKIPGGFIIRGEMVTKLRGDCDKLIQLIDEKIEKSTQMPNDWNEKFQVNIMTDPTPELFDNQESVEGETVLVVHARDMSPTTNQLIVSGVSTLSLFLTFLFVIATYSQNDIVMERLKGANSVGDYDLTWFNELISPLLISIGVTQACHEAGHLFIAKKDGFKITPPTILPLVALPFLSFKQSIKTSPKNFDSLFNFGMIGPAIGMIASTAFLVVGLQLTLTMDANAIEYAPSVPVFFLKLSTLGGTIVDNVIGGGQGIITQQDPFTPVKLHPFAIGGLASLMINCLDTIPLPGTDGGRMSQSLLGRSGQVAFGGVVYFALLTYIFFTGHRDIFLAFLIINSVARQDNEVPCRNEIDRAGLGQAAIALLMWSIAILTLTPMD